MRTLKRKTRSDKFPLTLHTTGQYCKKVKGKMYYFGSDKKWNDRLFSRQVFAVYAKYIVNSLLTCFRDTCLADTIQFPILRWQQDRCIGVCLEYTPNGTPTPMVI